MKTKIIKSGIIPAALALVVFAANANAQYTGEGPWYQEGKMLKIGPPGFPGGGGPHFGAGILMAVKHAAKELGITNAQKEKIKKLREDMRAEIKPLRKKQYELKKAMRAEFKKGNYSRAELTAKHEEIQKIRNQIGDLRFNFVLDVYDTLTSKQKKKLIKMIEEKAKAFGK